MSPRKARKIAKPETNTPRTAATAIKQPDLCELCGRKGVVTTEHHLTPRERGGTLLPTAWLCMPCHKQVHALYTNAQLEHGLNSIGALQQEERMARFIQWIRKQPASALPRIRKSKQLKER